LRISEGDAPNTKTRAEVLAAAATGPLKELLTRTPNWTVFNLGGTQDVIIVRQIMNRSNPGLPHRARFVWEATGIKGEVLATFVTAALQIEIRLNHTSRL
jgi:hypothetical protein